MRGTRRGIESSYLRSNVVRSTAEGCGVGVPGDVLLAHAEVGNLAVALGVEQYVVQL